MSGMIERVGRALAAQEGYAYDPFPYDERAIAAIKAMQEPTPKMYAVANAAEAKHKADLKHFDVTGFCGHVYQQMITESLRPDAEECGQQNPVPPRVGVPFPVNRRVTADYFITTGDEWLDK